MICLNNYESNTIDYKEFHRLALKLSVKFKIELVGLIWNECNEMKRRQSMPLY